MRVNPGAIGAYYIVARSGIPAAEIGIELQRIGTCNAGETCRDGCGVEIQQKLRSGCGAPYDTRVRHRIDVNAADRTTRRRRNKLRECRGSGLGWVHYIDSISRTAGSNRTVVGYRKVDLPIDRVKTRLLRIGRQWNCIDDCIGYNINDRQNTWTGGVGHVGPAVNGV